MKNSISKIAHEIATSNYIASISGAYQRTPIAKAQEVSLTKDALSQEVWRIVQLKEKRNKLTFGATTLRTKLQLRLNAKLQKRFEKQLPLRTSQSSWAGGATIEASYNILGGKNKESFLFSDSFREWSSNGKWSGNRSVNRLHLNPSDEFSVLGGLLTIFKKADAGKVVYPCIWYEQSRGFTVERKKGFVVDSYHVEAATESEAVVIVNKKKVRAEKIQNRRDAEVLNAKSVISQYAFCRAGVQAFCNDNGLDFTAEITVADLRNLVIQNRDLNCSRYATFLRKMGIVLNCK